LTKRGSETESERETERATERAIERARERLRETERVSIIFRYAPGVITTHEMMTDGLETG
jgi:hypothetical protein